MYIWAPCTSGILKNDLCANGVLFQNKTKKNANTRTKYSIFNKSHKYSTYV